MFSINLTLTSQNYLNKTKPFKNYFNQLRNSIKSLIHLDIIISRIFTSITICKIHIQQDSHFPRVITQKYRQWGSPDVRLYQQQYELTNSLRAPRD